MRAEALKRQGYSIAAIRTLARARLPKPVFDFTDGAAENETTLRRNEAAFDDIALLPHPLTGSASRDLSVTLFGRRLALPVVLGPTGLAGLMCPDGEGAAARAATAAGTAYCLSHGSVCTLEALAATGAAPRWMQVFIFSDRGFTRELAERSAAAKYDALVLTVDNQLTGNRERDIRNGFQIPPRFKATDLAAMAFKARWLWDMRRELGRITFGNYIRPGEAADLKALASRMGSLLDPSMSWADVAELRRIWLGPLLLKGVLHPDEAKTAVDQGIDGLIVSNHGGRQLDRAPATIDALEPIVAAVAGRAEVYLDGGVRRGTDVATALALGARAVFIGRPYLYALAAGGEAGVARCIEILEAEMLIVMKLLGAPTLAGLTRDRVIS